MKQKIKTEYNQICMHLSQVKEFLPPDHRERLEDLQEDLAALFEEVLQEAGD